MFRLNDNAFYGSEDDLVKSFIEMFNGESFVFSNDIVEGEFFEQVRVPDISRISDLIIYCGERRIVNVEFKLTDWSCLLSQAIDHLKWADYSYTCVPINCLMYYPQDFCKHLLHRGIGLIAGNEKTFVEVFRAKHNTYKNGKSKKIRQKVIQTIKPIKTQYELFSN